ncbi:hypothetical protein AB0J82_22650 [Asanoa sp. NPDC049518]|uniref:hypothetical protein n=1 Tax=unclassified Asanoa TaxID=2685164 RepID=UPI00341D87B6
MTDKALAAICVLLTQRDVPDGAGLRIRAESDGEHGLRLTIADRPSAGDAVVERAGARIFLDAGAVAALRGAALDASPDEAGGLRFSVASRSN